MLKPKVDLLLLGQPVQPVVSLPRRPSFILISTIENSEDTEEHHNNLANEIDGVAGVVLGSIR